MPVYQLDLLLPPDGRLGYRREISANDDAEAIKRADEIYDGLAAHVRLDRYVLYAGGRVVRERKGTKR